jgi:hypothetical protein
MTVYMYVQQNAVILIFSNFLIKKMEQDMGVKCVKSKTCLHITFSTFFRHCGRHLASKFLEGGKTHKKNLWKNSTGVL